MVGDYRGQVWLYLNVGNKFSPQLTTAGKITVAGKAIDVGDNAAPVVVDWNNDGKKDLLVGSRDRNLLLYINTGSNEKPVFSVEQVVANVNHSSAHPDVSDLNQDGKMDLLLGDEDGYFYFYKNIGRDNQPEFSGSQPIDEFIKVNKEARLDLFDWDQNGMPDIIASGEEGRLLVFFNRSAFTTIGSDGDEKSIPNALLLEQNYPNPFNQSTRIQFEVEEPGRITIQIFSISGTKIRTVADSYLNKGKHSVIWRGLNDRGVSMPAGIYFYVYKSSTHKEVKKMIFVP